MQKRRSKQEACRGWESMSERMWERAEARGNVTELRGRSGRLLWTNLFRLQPQLRLSATG